MPDVEAELILLIVSADAPRVAEQIAGLTAAGGLALHALPIQAMRDAHLDTADRALGARRLSLRIRTVAGGERLALKGPSRVTPWGGLERFELEGAWSSEALGTMLDMLGGAGVVLGPARAVPRAAAIETLHALGLHVIQQRDTVRWPRSIAEPGTAPGCPLAELAIDSVVYHLGRRDVRMHEVEIEVKATGGTDAAQSVAHGLRELFAPHLRPWPHGKLWTGLVIETLLAEGTLEPLLAPDGALTPDAVTVTAARLSAPEGE